MASAKREAPTSFGTTQLVKRQRSTIDGTGDGSAVVRVNGSDANGALIQSRGSGALPASVMEMSGHSGEVYAARFDPMGQSIASGSIDRSIMLWRTYGDCDNYGVLTGHKGAVLDLQWSRDSRVIFSASADATVASWDAETGQRIRRHTGHEDVVNCVDVGKRGAEVLVSCGDDGSIGVWDPRQKEAANYMQTDYPLTAVTLAEAGHELYSGGIDNTVSVWDLRKQTVAYTLTGHGDTITSLAVSPDGQFLLSNSHDGTARSWDIRPFAPTDRIVHVFDGATSGNEKNLIRASWDREGKRVAAGSSDYTVWIWDAENGKILHTLYGHRGCVNDVRFTPDESGRIASASTDKTILFGEIGS